MVDRITYIVLVQTLNPAQSINYEIMELCRESETLLFESVFVAIKAMQPLFLSNCHGY